MFWLIVLCLVILGWAWHFFIWDRNTKKNFQYLKKYHFIPLLNIYEQTKQKIDIKGKKVPRAVLLLHGFSSSTNDFTYLIEKLKEQQIPYFAPTLTGFGLGDFHLLKSVEASDWLRDTFQAYEVLSSIAEKIDVIGFSNGGCLAAILAQKRPVDKLILVSPYLSTDLKFYPWLISIPILKQIVCWLNPLPRKPPLPGRPYRMDILNPEGAKSFFSSKFLTIQSVKALWDLQQTVDFSKPLMSREVYALFGSSDLLIGSKTREIFQKGSAAYKLFEFSKSAHILLHDYEYQKAIETILQILK